jgi:outer membrane protein assembly factor BamE (lipoprotein component of BamABCDE complex)
MKRLLILSVLLIFSISGCKSVQDHVRGVRDESGERVTVGKVQAEIKTGMSGAEVAQILGSPNIVTTDEERREVWIYDKFRTETVTSQSSAGGSILILGLIDSFIAGGAPSVNSSSGASSRTQKTMTIIIKFDNEKKVRDFAYHQSSF